jgi:hypothetical protein
MNNEVLWRVKNEATNLEKSKAIAVTQHPKTMLCAGIIFLKDIKEYGLLETILFERYEEIDGEAYHVYRPIATCLVKQEKYLMASLLRRKLIEGVLSKAKSKYYKYDTSDYKICDDYSTHVIEWKGFPTHHAF